jgi:hypothetical protein
MQPLRLLVGVEDEVDGGVSDGVDSDLKAERVGADDLGLMASGGSIQRPTFSASPSNGRRIGPSGPPIEPSLKSLAGPTAATGRRSRS